MRLWLLPLAGARAAVNTKKHLDWLTHQRKHALLHRINRGTAGQGAHRVGRRGTPACAGRAPGRGITIPVHCLFIDRDDLRNPNKVPDD